VLPPAPSRLVAVGDLHGDLDKARRALVAARVLDPSTDRWSGGDSVLVQVGDVLDRGDGEIACLFLLERLAKEAALVGGAVHVLNGNHETMNVGGRFRYATPGGLADFLRFELVEAVGEQLREKCGCLPRGGGGSGSSSSSPPSSAAPTNPIRGPAHALHALAGGPAALEEAALAARARALSPGSGEITRRFLADKRVVLQVGSTVFVHGGLLPSHLASAAAAAAAAAEEGGGGGGGGGSGSGAEKEEEAIARAALDRLNAASAAWMRGESPPTASGSGAEKGMPDFLRGRDAVVWSRSYSSEDTRKADCVLLREALGKIPGAKRMVMGHTIQEAGVNGACEGAALRVDVGLSGGCGDGNVEVLEILADGSLPGSIRRLVKVETLNNSNDNGRKAVFSSRVLAVPGVSPALGGGGGLPKTMTNKVDEERSRWRLWSWFKGSQERERPPPSPPVAVSAAA